MFVVSQQSLLSEIKCFLESIPFPTSYNSLVFYDAEIILEIRPAIAVADFVIIGFKTK